MQAFEVSVLGGFRITVAGSPGCQIEIPGRKARALVAFLALPPGRCHERDRLAALLWGERGDADARHSLRQALVLLRRRLPGAFVPGDAVGLASDVVSVDAVRFETLARQAAPASLENAVRLYRADLLDGFHVDADDFSDWLRTERERLRETLTQILRRLLAHYSRAEATADAIRVALRLLDMDPLQEPVHRTLLTLYVRQGRRAAALNHYRHLVELLRRDLATDPEAKTRELFQVLLRRPTAPATSLPNVIADTTGEHAVSGGDPPIVGRDRELMLLDALADAARRGRGRVVLVRGEAGVGKTRLLDQLVTRWLHQSDRVILVRCHDIQRSVPLAVWTAALSEGCSAADYDRVLGRSSVPRRQLARFLGEHGTAPPDPDAATLANRTALLDTLVAVLSGLARERPLLIALDDAHWADASSLELVLRLGRRLDGLPMLLGLTARDEEVADTPKLELLAHDLARERLLDQIQLGALGRGHVDSLVRMVVGSRARADDLERLMARVWRLSEGNPLLAIETARSRPTRHDASKVGLPDRVRAIVAERLARLSPAARAMARLAAIIGRDFEFSLIARAAGLRRRRAAAVVDELIRGFVFRSNSGSLQFAHEAIRVAVAAELTPTAATKLHRAVAKALASRARDAPTIAKRLAYHYAEAGMTAKTVAWLRRYADHALRVCAADEARRALEQALAHIEALPAVRRDRARVDILVQLAPALSVGGRFGDILERLIPEEPLIERLGDVRLAGRYYLRLVLTQIVLEDRRGLSERIERGLQAAERSADAGARGRLMYAMAAGCFTDGALSVGLGHAQGAADLLARAGDQRWLSLALWMVGLHHIVGGALDDALDVERRSIAAALAAGDVGVASFGAVTAAWVHLERGDLTAAESQCRDVLSGSSEPINAVTALGLTALVDLERGHRERAVPVLEQVLTQLPVAARRELFASPLGEAYAAAGHVDRAQETALQLKAIAAASPSRWRRGRLQRLGAMIAASKHRVSDSKEALRCAVEDLMAVPAPLEVARTHIIAARLASQWNERESVIRSLALARRWYADVGAKLRLRTLDHLELSLGR